MAFNNIYKNKKVLVTGHTGFKGSWLCIWLKELGADVVGYALDPPSDPNNFTATALSGKVTHIHGDIRDMDQLLAAFDCHRPEFVFHLAAQAIVRSSYENPKLTFDTNAGGTVNVLEAIRKTPSVRVIVNITSDKCYENREWLWGYRENDQMGGNDPYSASKGCAELIFTAYIRSFFSAMVSDRQAIGAASCRGGNALGGGDWGCDRLIPDCARSLSEGKTIGIRNFRAVRPWQHVLELLSGYLWLGACLWREPEKYAGGWNFGPGTEATMTVGDVVNRFLKAWGTGEWKDLSEPEAVHEDAILRLCCDKAATQLGWRNILSLDETIDMTAEWYRQFYRNLESAEMYALCMKQIEYYTDKSMSGRLAWTMKP